MSTLLWYNLFEIFLEKEVIIMSTYRYYVEKSAKSVQIDLPVALGLSPKVRLFIRYDVQRDMKITDITFEDSPAEALPSFTDSAKLLYVEPVAGQFDAAADLCEQNIQLALGGDRPAVKTAKIYVFDDVTDIEFERIKTYLINPLEYAPANPCSKPPAALNTSATVPVAIPDVDDYSGLGLAMSEDDIAVVCEYFASEKRAPTLTEIMVLDTYWSDHCRHTTFNTIIEKAEIADSRVAKAYEQFKQINGDRDPTLMNIATAAMRHMRKSGELPMLDISDEINACTLKLGDEATGKYLFFKNETHNHPTEIEPYGGASTCIGGGIRDPLSGRAQGFQGMRIIGAGDPRQPVADTLAGKLPQRKLALTAAEGFSDYANYVGLSSGYCKELYHPGYVAKRMEAGALVASADRAAVRRIKPAPGDLVLLLGDRTGRDGVGGATGSSVAHDVNTVTEASCEVQKGNPQGGRKLQRLFRNAEATVLIKKCNDFGAGGVSVAVGELADGLEIDLDKVPLKYPGLNGTEIAISESQERMAIVIAPADLAKMQKLCDEANVETTVIAAVTEAPRLVMYWRGQKIVDIARKFLDTNGAKRYTSVAVPDSGKAIDNFQSSTNLSQKGLTEWFDSSAGGSNVFAPLGGKHALSEMQIMAAIIPETGGAPGGKPASPYSSTTLASLMSYGFDPYMTEADPFGGSVYAIVSSVAKLVAAGADLPTIHLSLQEFFPRCDSAEKWGLPFAALLGAFSAQMGLKIAAVGGKDSMSGSFGDLHVPPTLISFAVGVGEIGSLISTDFKRAESPVYAVDVAMDDYEGLRTAWEKYGALVKAGKVLSAQVGGDVRNMALGNGIGFSGDAKVSSTAIIFEAAEELDGFKLIGKTTAVCDYKPCNALEAVYKTAHPSIITPAETKLIVNSQLSDVSCVIPVLPGTTGEYDAAAALERAGARAQFVLIRNLTPKMLEESVSQLEKAISSAKMLVLPGGLESAGSITALFINPRIMNKVKDLLSRGGLILGINDGFKALVKLGLLGVSGEFEDNSTGMHLHRYVQTVSEDVKSPWLAEITAGGVYVQPISTKTARFAGEVSPAQIAFKYAGCGGIEAIISPCGRVMGKMGHFERYNNFTAQNIPGNKYLPLFEGAVKNL
jgi:phosphoribosylformylglycinamidine synthase